MSLLYTNEVTRTEMNNVWDLLLKYFLTKEKEG